MQKGYTHLKHAYIGDLFIIESDSKITGVQFNKPKDIMLHKSPLLDQAKQQINEYFDGIRKQFDLPFETNGTEFQLSAWKSLTKIPYGKTWSYKQQANNIKRPKAVRAIGAANGKNPIAIIIPCHRVIGSSGNLTGYAGGIQIKEKLLKLEGTLL